MALDLNRLRGAVNRAQGGDDGPLEPPPAPVGVEPEPAAEGPSIPGWFFVFLFALSAFAAYRFAGMEVPPPAKGLQGKLQAWLFYVTYYPVSEGWAGGMRLWAVLMKLSRFPALNLVLALAVLGLALWLGWQLLRWLVTGGSWVLWVAYFLPAVALACLWGWGRAFGDEESPRARSAAQAPPAAVKSGKASPAPKARNLEKGNAERRELLDLVRPMVEELLNPPVTFEVESVRRAGSYAYLRLTPVRPTGEPIDVRQTKLKNKSAGVLTEIVLRREGGEWKLEDGVIGSPERWAQRFCEAPYPRSLTGRCPQVQHSS